MALNPSFLLSQAAERRGHHGTRALLEHFSLARRLQVLACPAAAYRALGDTWHILSYDPVIPDYMCRMLDDLQR